jgi:hypothetical protein
MRSAARSFVLSLIAALLAAPSAARAQTNPIDDLLKLSVDAFNDLKYTKADSIARSVLNISAASPAQRTRAQMVMAASAYPDDPSAQRRPAALLMLKQLVKVNYSLKLPQELTWAGLDSVLDEAKRTTFSLQVTAEPKQTVAGFNGTAKLHVKSNKTGLFRLIIAPKTGSGVAVVDSLVSVPEGDITFRAMRDEKPIFTTGDYTITITAFEPGGRGDTVTVQYTLKAEAPPVTSVPVPASMDSSKLLKTRTGRSGAKAIFPALLVGGAAYALGSTLRGEGDIATEVKPATTSTAVAGFLSVSTIIAGFRDKGRPIPANIAANKAAGEAFQKSIADAQAENRRRIVEYKTMLTFELESK